MPEKDALGPERRQYIRLDSVFPVQFQVLAPDGESALSPWTQGFTSNISKGGICLAVNNLKPELAGPIENKQVKFSLKIEMPLAASPALALASVAWVRQAAGQPDRYLIGLCYEDILPAVNRRIIRYARTKRMFAPVVFTIIFILGIAFAVGSYLNVKLIKGNKALVEQLVQILQESSVAKQTIKQINKEKDDLRLKMDSLQLRIQTVEEERRALEKGLREEKTKLARETKLAQEEISRRISESSVLIDKLIQEKASLQEELIAVQHKENAVTEELLRLDRRKVTLEKANLDKMYHWLKIHQNPHTGLVMSFEGDSEVANWAFIYDQSLVAQAYTYFADFERAKRMLEFFARRAKRQDGLFFNAYYSNDGSPAEYSLHSGPNIWLGIAILHYSDKSKDKTYLALAEEIASRIIDLQAEDKEGGIRGGRQVDWYSTEHNLDAYAFFDMLYKITGKKTYLEAKGKVVNWLVKHTYDKTDIPIKRGKGDSTIATDTYAWSIAAIGPEKLEELGMNPDQIVEFAEENCAVEVTYERPQGNTITVKGFDFASRQNLGRGGIVSSEWTAQMIMAFKIMSEFYYKQQMIAKARAYALKADEYLNQLGSMIISSPSPSGQGEGCLPYATQELADTGHGWSTPKGKSTGSVAGTAYTIFAYYGYNPLELK